MFRKDPVLFLAEERNKFTYTVDALSKENCPLLEAWPEPNEEIANVISKEVEYDLSSRDAVNEMHKTMQYQEQLFIIKKNAGKTPLCEALDMKSCQKKMYIP